MFYLETRSDLFQMNMTEVLMKTLHFYKSFLHLYITLQTNLKTYLLEKLQKSLLHHMYVLLNVAKAFKLAPKYTLCWVF